MSKKTFIFNKLVRDKIPDLLNMSGIVVHTQRLSSEELAKTLKEKLVEEAQECAAAESLASLKEELADIVEVVNKILANNNIDFKEIENIRQAKQKEKGSFNAGIYISYIEVDEDHPKINNYREHTQCIKNEFWQELQNLMVHSEIVIDRPKNTAHPRYPTFIYPVDYGYLKGTAASDGNEIDIWVGTAPIKVINGILCTVDPIKKDIETKIIYACTTDEIAQICTIMNNVMKAIYIAKNR